jgi:hypothetical protein
MKQRKQLAILVVLLVILGGVVWYLNHSTEPVSPGSSALAVVYAPLGVESPAPRIWEMEASRKVEYAKTLRNIFNPNAPPPAEAVKPILASTHPIVGPQPEPPKVPPTLPLTFFGYGTIPNGTARRAFLTNREDIYIVGEGDTLLGRFRILKINNATIEFEEISTGLRNTAPLVLEEAGAGSPATPAPVS